MVKRLCAFAAAVVLASMSVSAQGMRENANDWLYDGVDDNELTAGGVGILPNIDSIREFKVLTHNYLAQYGSRHSGCDLRGSVRIRTLARHGVRSLMYLDSYVTILVHSRHGDCAAGPGRREPAGDAGDPGRRSGHRG